MKSACFALLFFGLVLPASIQSAPNILHIISDDMGYADIGCYGSEIETPNLDSLAAQGLRFTNFYVNNMCWPTRASLMTGLYPKTALPHKGSSEGGLHKDATTLPEALKTAGYTTLMSGKWHLSTTKEIDGPGTPHHKGFDHYFGTVDGASDFFAPNGVALNGERVEHEWQDNPDYYYTDSITDYALKFLKEADQEMPFYLYLSFNAAHWPLHARPEDIEKYKSHYAMGWDKLREQRHAKMKGLGVIDPEWKLSPRNEDTESWEEAEDKEWQQRRMEVYAAQVTSMDENIGRVIRYLKAVGKFDDTLILFHHDNGGCHVEYGTERTGSWTREFTTDGKKTPIVPGNVPGIMPGPQSTFQSYGFGWANAANTPFRYFKQYDHEGGTRSPLIVSWPDGISHDLEGGIVYDLGHAIDIMPTFLEAAGAGTVAQKPMPLEGMSLLSSITGAPSITVERGPIFWAHNKGWAVREGDWKLVSKNKKTWELYNLVEDGTELNDLSTEHPERVEAMTKRWQEWDTRTDLGKNDSKKGAKRKGKK